MTANEVVIAAGAVVSVAILAAGAVACVVVICAGALDRLAPLPCCSPDVPMTDAEVAALCAEDERMEILRRHIDELWEADEDPRDAFADAVLAYCDWIERLPEVTS